MSRKLRSCVLLVAVISSITLAVGHDSMMEPTSSATFPMIGDSLTPQERVSIAHRQRAVPVAFAVGLLISIGGGLWLAKTAKHFAIWVVIDLIAGACAFAFASPFVPLTGRESSPNFTGRKASIQDIANSASVGAELGVGVGCVAALMWVVLTKRLRNQGGSTV